MPAEPPAGEQKFEKRLWVSHGLVRVRSPKGLPTGSLGVRLQRVDDNRLLDHSGVFTSQTVRRLRPGAVYTILTSADDETIRSDSATFVEMWEDKSKVAEWQAASEEAEVAYRAAKLEKQHMGDGRAELLKLLEPLRNRYYRTDRLGQEALEAVVLRVLRTPVRHGNVQEGA